MNVFETLAQSARQWPDRIAIIDAGGSLDYRRSGAKSRRCGVQLDAGVREGQGVGVRARNGRAFVIGALAALGCGAVIMPIHHQMKPDELADMLAQAPLCVIIDDGSGMAQPGRTIAWKIPAETVCVSRAWTIPNRRSRRESKTPPSCDSLPEPPAQPKAWC